MNELPDVMGVGQALGGSTRETGDGGGGRLLGAP